MRTLREASIALTGLTGLGMVLLASATAEAQQPQPPFGPSPGAQPPFGPQPGAQPPAGQPPAGQPGAQPPFGPSPGPGGAPPAGGPGASGSFGAEGNLGGGMSFGGDAAASGAGAGMGAAPFGGPQGPDMGGEDDKEKAEWERREYSLIEQPNLFGSTGLLRTSHAGSGAQGTFRVSFITDWFSTSGFLCDPNERTAAGTPTTCDVDGNEDDASHIGGFFTLNATPLSFLEAFASIRTYANSNSLGSPELLQVLGDTTLGVKAFTPPEMLGPFAFGGEMHLNLLNGTGDVGLAGGGTGFTLRGLATADLRELKPRQKGLPLRFNLNLGYKLDNSAQVVEDVEKARADASGEDTDRIPITRIERFGLGINRVDFFQIAIGAEAPLKWIQPFLEYHVDVPINRQGYECNTAYASQGDVCLGLDNFNDPNSGGVGYAAVPSRLSLGTRVTPFKKAFRGLSGMLAFDIGLSGTSTFIEEVAPTAPWTLYLGLGYAFDTKERPVPIPKMAPPPPPQVMPAPQNFIRGLVHEQDSQAGIADAIISVQGSADPPVASGPDGRFLTRDLPPGTYSLDVRAEGYKPGVCTGTIPPRQQPGMGQPGMGPGAQPGAFGPQPGQFGGQPGMPGQQPGMPGQMQPGMGAPPTGPQYIDVDCVLEAMPREGALVGTVVDAEGGAPVPAAIVTVIGVDGGEKKITADGKGAFKLTKLEPGDVTLRVEASGYLNQVEEATLKANAETSKTLRINKKPKRALVQVQGNEIKLKEQILFETDSAKIVGSSNSLLSQIADVMITQSNIRKVEIQGHTDNTGTRDHNQELSESRANAVRDWLISAGVQSGRMTAKGYGQDRPIAPNVTAANKAKNRRVQFIILEK